MDACLPIELEKERHHEPTASLEALPLETLLEIAEKYITLESLVHWTTVSMKLAEVAWQVLLRPRYWATILAYDTNHERLGIKPVESGDRLKLYYRAPDPVINFIKENKVALRETVIQITKEGYVWRREYIRCNSPYMSTCGPTETAKLRHEPCWETGWCECTGGRWSGRSVRPFSEIENDEDYGCCARKFRHW